MTQTYISFSLFTKVWFLSVKDEDGGLRIVTASQDIDAVKAAARLLDLQILGGGNV